MHLRRATKPTPSESSAAAEPVAVWGQLVGVPTAEVVIRAPRAAEASTAIRQVA